MERGEGISQASLYIWFLTSSADKTNWNVVSTKYVF